MSTSKTLHAHYNVIARTPYTWCGEPHKGEATEDLTQTNCAICQMTIEGEREFSVAKSTGPTQLKLKPYYRVKLARLSEQHSRSMANMVEVLIDNALVAKDN